MADCPDLACLLDAHMTKASIGDARLARQANTIAGNPFFIHRSTIRNWRTGSVHRVNNWRQLAALSVALGLDEARADELLRSGGCPSISAMKVTSLPTDQTLLAYWTDTPTRPGGSIPPGGGNGANVTPPSPEDSGCEVRRSEPALPGAKRRMFVGTGAFVTAGMAAALAAHSFGYLHPGPGKRSGTLGNLLTNSGFEEGGLGWISYVNDAAVANFDIDEETLRIDVGRTAEKGWHITLNQKDLEVTAGNTYTARFRVRGDGPTAMNVDITRVTDPRTTLSFDNSSRQTVATTSDWVTRTIEFEAIETVSSRDGGARLLFKFGRSGKGRIYLDDIEFYAGRAGGHEP